MANMHSFWDQILIMIYLKSAPLPLPKTLVDTAREQWERTQFDLLDAKYLVEDCQASLQNAVTSVGMLQARETRLRGDLARLETEADPRSDTRVVHGRFFKHAMDRPEDHEAV